MRDQKVGDLVLMVGGTVRKQWIRGYVVKPIPRRDGRARQALVRTAFGVFRRSAVKLAPLDIVKDSDPEGVLDGDSGEDFYE